MRLRTGLVVLLLVALLPGPAAPAAVNAQSSTTLSIQPAYSEVNLNSTAAVSLYVSGGVNINAFDVAIAYDPQGLALESWAYGDYLSSLAQVYLVNNPGEFRLAATQLARPGVSGDGTLLTFIFRGIAAGPVEITITYAAFSSPQGQSTIPQTENGVLVVLPGTQTPTSTPSQTATVTRTPTVTRTVTPSPSLTPSRTATVTRTPTVTRTVTPGPSLTPSRTATVTRTPTVTRTVTPGPSLNPGRSATASPTGVATATAPVNAGTTAEPRRSTPFSASELGLEGRAETAVELPPARNNAPAEEVGAAAGNQSGATQAPAESLEKILTAALIGITLIIIAMLAVLVRRRAARRQ